MKKLYEKYREIIINTIGWVVGVLFAYPLNRKWVFKSTNPKILKEFFGLVLPPGISRFLSEVFL